MNVVQLIAPGPTGGAESAVRSLAAGLREGGDNVEIVTLTQNTVGEHPFVGGARRDGTPVTDVRLGRRRYVAEAGRVAQLVSARHADVIHSHLYHADTVGFLARRRTGSSIPQVATVHGITRRGWRDAAYIALDMWLLRRCAAVICVASNSQDYVLGAGVDPGIVHLVPNGYLASDGLSRAAAREELGLARDTPVVGWVGRMTKEKGGDLFIRALAEPATAAITAVLIGDGSERPALEVLARKLHLPADRVRFVGRIEDAARLYRAFDALALSSRTEGTPMVLLEAMAAGVPIVSFRVGGVGAVLDDRSAFLVPAANVAALAEALGSAIHSPRDVYPRIEHARHVFEERYSAAACARRVAEIYRDVLVQRRVREGRAAATPTKSLQNA